MSTLGGKEVVMATNKTVFDHAVRTTDECLASVAQEFETDDQAFANRALRACLHGELTVEVCAHFAAQLPEVMRGIYSEGWDPRQVPWITTSTRTCVASPARRKFGQSRYRTSPRPSPPRCTSVCPQGKSPPCSTNCHRVYANFYGWHLAAQPSHAANSPPPSPSIDSPNWSMRFEPSPAQ